MSAPSRPEPSAVLEAPAKLTVSLSVGKRRADGLHALRAEMVSVSLSDTLAFSEGEGLELDYDASVPPSSRNVPEGESNLVLAALRACGERARVRLRKRIPPGAGLGGGSADAAAALRWARGGIWSRERLLEVAARLGSDVPFCVIGGRAAVGGVGDEVEPLEFRPQRFALLTPPFGLSTAAVYARWDELGGPEGDNGNDLEPAAVAVEPRLALWRDSLAAATGGRPRLAGSGSTWFVELEPESTPAGAGIAGWAEAAGSRVPIHVVSALEGHPLS